MKPEISIRQACIDDSATLLRWVRALAQELGDADAVSSSVADFKHHGFGQDKQFGALLAETGTEPVGMCLFFLTFSSWRGELGVYIQDLYITPNFRDQNAGQRLIKAAARLGRDQGATHLRLSLHSSNHRGAAFYEKIGITAQQNEQIFQASDTAFMNLTQTS